MSCMQKKRNMPYESNWLVDGELWDQKPFRSGEMKKDLVDRPLYDLTGTSGRCRAKRREEKGLVK